MRKREIVPERERDGLLDSQGDIESKNVQEKKRWTERENVIKSQHERVTNKTYFILNATNPKSQCFLTSSGQFEI